MNSATPAFLAVLLVTSLLAMPVIAGPEANAATHDAPQPEFQPSTLQHASTEPVEAENTTNRLQPTGDTRDEVRTEYTTYGPDLGVALASVDDELRIDQEQYTLVDSEFDSASNDDREQMVSAAVDKIEDQTDVIEERERDAVREHADGEVSDTELIHTLLRNYHESQVLYDALNELDGERTDAIPGYALSRQQVRADETVLELQQTSLRSLLDQASQSTDTDGALDVQIQTAEDGYSVSAIDGDTYVTETTRFDNRDADGENQFGDASHSDMIDRTTELYPWAADQSGLSFNEAGNQNLYVTTIEYDQNRLQVYLDGATNEITRESQEHTLESLPEENNESWENDDLEVMQTETPVNGPSELTVTDSVSGDPVSATIEVDGTEVGETDDDGTVWFLPPGDEYELTAETDSREITETVSPD
ncbi:DUF7096 domain-containing protein [Natronorubrum daqingense]|uniref:Uncharacterized protein n=1 Tax=Natronorubrum daqingense TaxID=588898 RepID=A0A1N7A7Z0_9EURY|nr:hypothetical protein [Natronorubrum daqingense]APX98077.1 hypothetical protein BB347_16450 [Natronorubrum daqingense]SIR35267.1 hypothetical protein SAMN05421809_1070 [Natronorubrum daqingense]